MKLKRMLILLFTMLVLVSFSAFILTSCSKGGNNTEKFIMTFNANGHGTAPTAQTLNSGDKATLPTTLTADGYTFGGWYKEAACENEWKFDTDTVTGNVTVYAKWTINSYTLSFDANGHGTAPTAQTVNYGDKGTAPKALTADGYTFGGWYKEAACENEWKFDTDTVTGNVTVYAKWTINSYTLSFDANGHGTAPTAQTINYGDKGTAPKALTADDYTFGGWYKEAACENEWKFDTDTVTGNVTVYAKWTINSYTLSFDANGHGTAPTAQTINYGDKGTAPKALTAEGYTFARWYKESSCENEWNFDTDKVTGNITLYAKWIENREIKSIEISDNSGHAVSFAKGLDFNFDGLVIIGTYIDDTKGEIDRVLYTVDASNYTKEIGEYSITVKLNANASISTSYKVNVTEAEVSSIELADNSAQTTEFLKGEQFNYEGLRLIAVYTDGTKQAIESYMYNVDSSSYNGSVAGTYSISIKIDEKVVFRYDVKVSDYDFSGEYVLYLTDDTDEENPKKLQIVTDLFSINNNCQYSDTYKNGQFTDFVKFTLVRQDDGLICISTEEYGFFMKYNPETKELSSYETVFEKINLNEYAVLSTVFQENDLYMAVKKGEGISQDSFDFITKLALCLYKDSKETTVVTTEDTFSNDAVLYLGAIKVDYTGKPFVGKYWQADGKLIYTLSADGKASAIGSAEEEYPYSAKESGENFIITIMGIARVFDTKAKTLTYEDDDYIDINYLFDSTTHVIVTLTASDELRNKYEDRKDRFDCQIAVRKGEALNLIVDNNKKLFLDGYLAGDAITTDKTFTITSVVESDMYLFTGFPFGTFADGNFTFTYDGTVTYGKGQQSINGTYKVTDLTKNSLFITIHLGEDTIESVYLSDDKGNNYLTIEEGKYVGNYTFDNLYKGMPFIGGLENLDDSEAGILMSDNGYYNLSYKKGENLEYLWGRYTVTGVTESGYTFTFRYDSGEDEVTVNGSYDIATKVLKYGDVEYKDNACIDE